MTEQQTEQTEQTEQNAEPTEVDTVTEDASTEPEIVKPNLDELEEPIQTMVKGMFTVATKAREDYVKVYQIIDSQGDKEKILVAERDSNPDEQVRADMTSVKELQSQIDELFAKVDARLNEIGAVKVPSEEDLENYRTEAAKHRKAFQDTVDYVNEHLVPNFGNLFEQLPGTRRRGTSKLSSDSGSKVQYEMTTRRKPIIKAAILNGTKVLGGPEGKSSNFTVLAQVLKKESGVNVPIGDLHDAWKAAAHKDDVNEIDEDLSFRFTPKGYTGNKEFFIKIERKDPDES